MNEKTKVVFLGGIESGKTSTIESLWQENVLGYQEDRGTYTFQISENLIGRENVEFEVVELPRINYTSDKWIEKANIVSSIESADVLVYLITFDEISISSRRNYIESIFKSLHLKEDVVIVIAYGMADWVLTPNTARNFGVSKSKQISLNSISSVIEKLNLLYLEFECFKQFDSTFSVSSIVPYSNVLNWNIDELKYQIWNGIVVSMNNKVFDDSLPTLVMSGKTGCGKTSTINVLWNKDLATDRAVSCTKFPAVMHIEDEFEGKHIAFNLVDLPGIGESMEANSIYHNFYYKFIAKASVLVCLSQADRRAYKQDQVFYADLIKNKILKPEQNIIMGINQADLLFKDAENPSGIDLNKIPEGDTRLKEKTDDYYECVFKEVFSDFPKLNEDSVVIYSVFQKWNLNHLKQTIYNLF